MTIHYLNIKDLPGNFESNGYRDVMFNGQSLSETKALNACIYDLITYVKGILKFAGTTVSAHIVVEQGVPQEGSGKEYADEYVFDVSNDGQYYEIGDSFVIYGDDSLFYKKYELFPKEVTASKTPNVMDLVLSGKSLYDLVDDQVNLFRSLEYVQRPVDMPIKFSLILNSNPYVLLSSSDGIDADNSAIQAMTALKNALAVKTEPNAFEYVITFVCVNVNTDTTQNLLVFITNDNNQNQPGVALPMSFITQPTKTSPVNMIFPFDMVIRDVVGPKNGSLSQGTIQLWQNGIQTGHFFDLSALGADNSGRSVYDVPLQAGTQIQMVISEEVK